VSVPCQFQDGVRWSNSLSCPRRPHLHHSDYRRLSMALSFSIFPPDKNVTYVKPMVSSIEKRFAVTGEDPRATGGLVSNLPHPRVNKTKQDTPQSSSLARVQKQKERCAGMSKEGFRCWNAVTATPCASLCAVDVGLFWRPARCEDLIQSVFGAFAK